MPKYFVVFKPDKNIRTRMSPSVDEKDIHTTLQYLGELSDDELEQTKKVLRDISKRNTDFVITYNNKKPDIKGKSVASNMYRTKRLMKLQQDIHKNTGKSDIGYFDKRLYSPHITTGKSVPKSTYRPTERVDKFYLYKRDKNGYSVVDSYRLKDRNILQRAKDYLFGDYEDV